MFALYIHWPFCLKKCPYCDFNSHVSAVVDQDRWRRALLQDLHHFGQQTRGRRLTSVFFGGGTPSLMEASTVAALLDRAGDYWQTDDTLEVTLEANPTSSEAAKFAAYKTAGINRLSIGVQSFDDRVLKQLGRQHAAAEARLAIAQAQAVFARTSFDLIYATPGQTRRHWRQQLDQALDLAGDHLSLYQLTIESGTAFHRDGVAAADGDLAADLYEDTQHRLAEAGLSAYEISNHARPGQACRHNLVYWQGGDYVGIGPGAHGRLRLAEQTVATHQIHNPDSWLRSVDRLGHGTAKRRTLTAQDRAEELLILGLRLTEGIDLAAIRERTGIALIDYLDAGQLTALKSGGYLVNTESRVTATADGLARLNAVIAKLLV
ncbi:MAG: coproporphyrinogen III oxidase [Rhodospirillales bacterium]|nr:coproporphyrinogen III oxidase [Rhodospirillales bacterium]